MSWLAAPVTSQKRGDLRWGGGLDRSEEGAADSLALEVDGNGEAGDFHARAVDPAADAADQAGAGPGADRDAEVGAELVQGLYQRWDKRLVVALGLGHVSGALDGKSFTDVLWAQRSEADGHGPSMPGRQLSGRPLSVRTGCHSANPSGAWWLHGKWPSGVATMIWTAGNWPDG